MEGDSPCIDRTESGAVCRNTGLRWPADAPPISCVCDTGRKVVSAVDTASSIIRQRLEVCRKCSGLVRCPLIASSCSAKRLWLTRIRHGKCKKFEDAGLGGPVDALEGIYVSDDEVEDMMGGDAVWSVAVTTIGWSLRGSLRRTIRSVRESGFPITFLAVDGRACDSVRKAAGLENVPIVDRPYRVDVARNWFSAAALLFAENPNADFYMIVQDDVVFAKNCRRYIEGTAPSDGYMNLCTWRDNHVSISDKPFGWYHARYRNEGGAVPGGTVPRQFGIGAQALAFPRSVFVDLISSKTFLASLSDKGKRLVDGKIVDAMNLAGYYEWVHNPSLVQHLGLKDSTIGNKYTEGAESFPGEGFDCMTMLQ